VPCLEKALNDFDFGPEAFWDLSKDSFSEDPTGKSEMNVLRKKIPIMLLVSVTSWKMFVSLNAVFS